mmetsp:Transcript_81666/g.253580  ORF Transcript_81666/g.253580 Transcript_81666/m.253580 type:complete len:216 (-) Transcript_81666:286-933(-)
MPRLLFSSISALLMPKPNSGPSSSSSSSSSSLASPCSTRLRFCSYRTSRYRLRAFLAALRSRIPPWHSRSAMSATIGTTLPALPSCDATMARTAGAAGTWKSARRAPGQSSSKQLKRPGSWPQLRARERIADTSTEPLVVASLSKRNCRVPDAGFNAAIRAGTFSSYFSKRSFMRSTAWRSSCLITPGSSLRVCTRRTLPKRSSKDPRISAKNVA